MKSIRKSHAFIISILYINSCALPLEKDEFVFDCGIPGETIELVQVCDGEPNCSNAADEYDCRGIQCPPYSFQCRYGACIPQNALCNGNNNCYDGSDESSFICGTCHDEEKIKCGSGNACIDKWRLCDGNIDCPDASDETEALCKLDTCTMQQFRCHYGACIDGLRRCNGRKDCADGSDEIGCLNSRPEAPKNRVKLVEISGTTEESCEIPLNELHLLAHSPNQNAALQPGSKVGVSTRVRFYCAPNAVMVGDYDEVLCTTRGWQYPVPRCIVLCDEAVLHRSVSTTVTCERRNGTAIDCTHIVPGTIARFQCAIQYQLPHSEWSPLMTRRCESNGQWSGESVKCMPACGISDETVLDSIAGSALMVRTVDATAVPWHAVIYSSVNSEDENTLQRICGGAIISTKLVISAAHCFEKVDSELYDPDFFYVVTGHIGRNDSETRSITSIHTEGYDSYRHDIAVVVLSKPLTYSRVISLICLDWAAPTFVEPAATLRAYVVGWNTAMVNGSKQYRRIEVTAWSNSECKKLSAITALGADYQLDTDMFCIQPTRTRDKLCPGESGAGVFVKLNNKNQLLGIVSHTPSRQFNCTSGLVMITAIKEMPQALKLFINSRKDEE